MIPVNSGSRFCGRERRPVRGKLRLQVEWPVATKPAACLWADKDSCASKNTYSCHMVN
jgi:hypothetical protein